MNMTSYVLFLCDNQRDFGMIWIGSSCWSEIFISVSHARLSGRNTVSPLGVEVIKSADIWHVKKMPSGIAPKVIDGHNTALILVFI